MVKAGKNPADYILPLNMNGLSGRMLRLPAPADRKREILIVSGQHTSIERMMSLAEYLNGFGAVTVPDLPGFGGMESFYKIHEKPTLDNLADYLAAFVKLRYRNRRVTIIGLSLGFSVATRMLQKYPELAKKVDLLISFAGFVSGKDFKWKKRTIIPMKIGCVLLSRRLPAAFCQHVILRAPIIRATYRSVESRHPKFKDGDKADQEKRINFEIKLWQINDVRTWVATGLAMFNMDLCGVHVDLPVYHITIEEDHYFDNLVVEQHMRTIYKDFKLVKTKLPIHAPSILATTEEVKFFVPPKIRQLLRKKV